MRLFQRPRSYRRYKDIMMLLLVYFSRKWVPCMVHNLLSVGMLEGRRLVGSERCGFLAMTRDVSSSKR